MKKKADIYRMVTPDHLCPWGIKALDLLKRHGLEVTDHHLKSMEASQQYKEENDVDETPQIFVEGAHDQNQNQPKERSGQLPISLGGQTFQEKGGQSHSQGSAQALIEKI